MIPSAPLIAVKPLPPGLTLRAEVPVTNVSEPRLDSVGSDAVAAFRCGQNFSSKARRSSLSGRVARCRRRAARSR